MDYVKEQVNTKYYKNEDVLKKIKKLFNGRKFHEPNKLYKYDEENCCYYYINKKGYVHIVVKEEVIYNRDFFSRGYRVSDYLIDYFGCAIWNSATNGVGDNEFVIRAMKNKYGFADETDILKVVNICDVEYGECFLYNNEVHMKVNPETYKRILKENDCFENIVVNLENCKLNGLNDSVDVIMVEVKANVRMCCE